MEVCTVLNDDSSKEPYKGRDK